jgi:hypothetical protein
VRSPYEYTIFPCSTTTIALEFIREMSAWTESSPALLHPMRVGSGTRCQVSPGNTAATGCATRAAALGARVVARHAAAVMTRTTARRAIRT